MHEEAGEDVGVDVGTRDADDELGHIAHRVEEVAVAAEVGGGPRLPKVDVDNGERAVEWPGVHELRSGATVRIGEDAMGALGYQRFDVRPHFGPKKLDPEPIERFVTPHVAGGWGGVVQGTDFLTERLRDDDEQKSGFVPFEGFVGDQAVVLPVDVAVPE